MIELLIVIVVLGILAAVVIFALGGITGKSAAASCQADGATVSTAYAAFNAQNPSVLQNDVGSGSNGNTAPTIFGATAALTATATEALLSGTSYGGPYVQSWPNNLPHYAYQLAWSQVSTGTSASNPGLWSIVLQVATGETQGGTAPNYTYTPANAGVAIGNLIASGSPAGNIPGGANAPWNLYIGPNSCTGVQ